MHVIVLSPHRDDAAFSCGLTLHGLLLAGNSVTIVNVCTISAYAPYASESVQAVTEQITALRTDEDYAFLKRLREEVMIEGAVINLVDLGWKDVPLRWEMEDAKALSPLDIPTLEVQALQHAFRSLATGNLILAPLALGGHIDHRLVSAAAARSFSTSSLIFYEDLPYACRMSGDHPSMHAISSPLSSEIWLPEGGDASGRKRDYASCYASQIAIDVADELDCYARDHGGRERFVGAPETLRMLKKSLNASSSFPCADAR